MSAIPKGTGIEIKGLEHQVALWNDWTHDAQIALIGPLGCGKTTALAVKEFLLRNVNRNTDGMIVVPTLPMARRIHMRDWPRIWYSLGVVPLWQASSWCWQWPWGDRTWIVSAEYPERLMGPTMANVLIDEPAQIPREAYERAVLRARDPRAKCRQVVLAGTPEGINWLSELFANPEPPRKTIWARQWHPSVSWYPERIRDTYGYDPNLWATYGEGKFVPLRAGLVYRMFDPARHVSASARYQTDLPLVLACDFNVDAMRWLVLQGSASRIEVFDEIAMGRDSSTQEAAEEFLRRWGAYAPGGVTVTGDAAGRARSTSGATDYYILRRRLREYGFRFVDVRVPPNNPLEKDRVDAVNLLFSGRTQRSIAIHPRCKELVRDLHEVTWRQGTPKIDKAKDPMRSHASDALGYAVWNLFRPGGTASGARGGIFVVRRSENPAFGEF